MNFSSLRSIFAALLVATSLPLQVSADSNVNVPYALRLATEAFTDGIRGDRNTHYELDEGRIHAGFFNNLFQIGSFNLMSGTAIPRYETKVITNTVIRVIPSTEFQSYTVINRLGGVRTNGEGTLGGKGELVTARAKYLAQLAGAKKWQDYKPQAIEDLKPCIGAGAVCSVDIGTPQGTFITGDADGNTLTGTGCDLGTGKCDVMFTVTGSYSEPDVNSNGGGNHSSSGTGTTNNPDPGTPGADGEWKATYEAYTESTVLEPCPEGEECTVTVTEEEETLVTERAKKEWQISFAPVVTLQSEYTKLVLNQAGNMEDLRKSIQQQSIVESFYNNQNGNDVRPCVEERRQQQQAQYQQDTRQRTQQQFPDFPLYIDNCGPYVVKKHFDITAGAGVAMSANYTNAGLLSAVTPSVTLLATLGGGAYSIRTVDTYKKGKKARHLRIPRDVTDFDKWRSNDSLQYDVHGGIVLTGGVGFYGLSAGVTYVAQGEWKKTYIKLDDNTVFARLDKDKLMSFGMNTAAVFISLSAQKFITWEKGVSFTFDISTRKGRELLEDFMAGKIKVFKMLLS